MTKPAIQRDPILTRGGLTNRVYVVTKWRDLGNGNIEAVEKYDVTDQYGALRAAESGSEDSPKCPLCGVYQDYDEPIHAEGCQSTQGETA